MTSADLKLQYRLLRLPNGPPRCPECRWCLIARFKDLPPLPADDEYGPELDSGPLYMYCENDCCPAFNTNRIATAQEQNLVFGAAAKEWQGS